MSPEEKIAGAAEIIVSEVIRRGSHISLSEATELAKTLYQFWSERVQLRHLKPGDVAQHLRDRYDGHPYIGEAPSEPRTD